MYEKRLIKTLSLLVVALILIAAKAKFWRPQMTSNADKTLLVALNTGTPLSDLDPSKITLASDYSVLELLFSPLVEYNNQGEIIGAVAKRFYWEDNKLIFELGNATFSSGRSITAEDVVASFKRLMILNSNSHGDLVNLLCLDKRPESLQDHCEGLKAEGNRVVIIPEKKNTFILPLLTSIDYSILPAEIIDNESLKLSSLENTSGPYRLVTGDTGPVLVANPNHWHFHAEMPQKIEFKRFSYKTSAEDYVLKQFSEKKVDFIPTASELRLSDIPVLTESTKIPISIHTTNPMYLAYAEYTKVGQLLPQEKRRHLLACFRRGISKTLIQDVNGRIPTLQILPPSSEGNLSLNQTNLMESELKKYSNPCDASGIRIALPEELIPFYKSALDSEIRNLTYVGYPRIARFGDRSDKDVPELTITSVDVTAIEDINFISYSVKNGLLSPPDEETPTTWLKKYFETTDKSQRILMLQNIQFNTIWENPKIIPLSIRPYVSVINSKWKTDFSKLFPNDPFWKIKLK